jgi:hypothetical protein
MNLRRAAAEGKMGINATADVSETLDSIRFQRNVAPGFPRVPRRPSSSFDATIGPNDEP